MRRTRQPDIITGMKHAVIVAGGVGTRLWPLSRKNAPKQFQKFIGNRTLIQQTFDRIVKNVPAENIWVMTGAQYVGLVTEQLPEINIKHIVTEPVGRNTAAATGLALLHVLREDPDALVFGLLPADHFVGKEEVFNLAVESVFKFLETNKNYVVTIGINPTEPNTGLGYIKMGELIESIDNQKIFKVDSFHEKPDLETAEKFLEQSEYLWNGGCYLFSAAQMLEHYRHLAPEITEKLEKFIDNPDDTALYESIPSEPIDKAISEKLETLAVLPVDMDWSDIGSWSALHDILSDQTKKKQVVVGDHLTIDTTNSLIFGHKKLIATVGLDNVIVVDTEDAILIAQRDAVQDVKKIVEQLQEQKRTEFL